MKLFELADDAETYGEQAGWWLVVSDDGEKELSNPFPTEQMAQTHLDLLQPLEGIYNWWMTTPGFQDGEDDMPAELFDGMKDAIAKANRITTKRTLPPDPEAMNDARAEWADEAIKTFIKRTGTDYEDSLGDLLGDLLHWCDRHNFDFDIALDRGRCHYTEETGGMPWQKKAAP